MYLGMQARVALHLKTCHEQSDKDQKQLFVASFSVVLYVAGGSTNFYEGGKRGDPKKNTSSILADIFFAWTSDRMVDSQANLCHLFPSAISYKIVIYSSSFTCPRPT